MLCMTMGCLYCVWVGVALGRMVLPSALEGVGVMYLETPSIGGTRPHDPVGGTICRRRAALRLSPFIRGTRPRDPAVLGGPSFISVHRRHAASGPSCAGGPSFSGAIGGTRPRDPVTSFIGGTRPQDPVVLGGLSFISVHRRHAASGPSCAGGPSFSGAIGGTRPRDPVTSFIGGTRPRDLAVLGGPSFISVHRRHAASGPSCAGPIIQRRYRRHAAS